MTKTVSFERVIVIFMQNSSMLIVRLLSMNIIFNNCLAVDKNTTIKKRTIHQTLFRLISDKKSNFLLILQ